jgi:predicted short-subunit dehydrogenase-like oxidoreductase (DUF2520 family)
VAIKTTITLIGSGNLANALGPALKAAGYKIEAVAHRPNSASRRRAAALARKLGTRVILLADVQPSSDIIWLCHTDDALAHTASLLAQKPGWKGKMVLHSSGALTSDVLMPLKTAGAAVASLHPMMTFVPGTSPPMKDVPFGMEGDSKAVAVCREIAKSLGSEVFLIRKSAKVLYHALGSFSSPMLVATLVTAERVGQAAGLSRKQLSKIMRPILEQTLRNYLEKGAAAAFSGPLKRGDIITLRRHLENLRLVPGASEVYRALIESALLDLPVGNKEQISHLVSNLVLNSDPREESL